MAETKTKTNKKMLLDLFNNAPRSGAARYEYAYVFERDVALEGRHKAVPIELVTREKFELAVGSGCCGLAECDVHVSSGSGVITDV